MHTERIGNEDVVRQLPWSLQKLATLERFHLHKRELFQNPVRDPSFDWRYLPQNCGAIRLPCFWVRRRLLYVCGHHAQAENEMILAKGAGHEQRMLLPIHPLSLGHCKEFLAEVGAQDAASEGLHIWAVPTSSTRTFLAWPDGAPQSALFVKTALQSPLFGDRRILDINIARSVGLWQLAQQTQDQVANTLRYLPESLGYVPRMLPHSGVIFRSMPPALKADRCFLAPLFSLCGGAGDHQPLFLAMASRGVANALGWVEDLLCASFARLWLVLALRYGLMLEAHAQDLMLAISSELSPLGYFVYKDFEGLQVDWELRRSLKLPDAPELRRSWAWRETYATWGHPYGELVWYKWGISLFDYLHFVLNELNTSICEWQSQGVLKGDRIASDHLTMTFSRNLMSGIEELFGVRVGAHYNIHHDLKRFLLLLVRVRRSVMGECR